MERRKIDNDDKPKKKRAPPKPRKQQLQSEPKQDIPIIYYI